MRSLLFSLAVVASSALVPAQTGSLDQTSPGPSGTGSASFNADVSSLTWQCQVRAGLAGPFEGVTLGINQGNAGAQMNVRLRAGAGWNTSPVLQDVLVTLPASGVQDVFVDFTSANLNLNVGDLFVIEIQGTNTGIWVLGSYVAPPGTPLYAEPLFLGGPGCFADCGWRIGFQTWVRDNPGTAFCFGDGIDVSHTTPCPCGNVGSAGHGCANSVNGAGALLQATGAVATDSVVLHGSGMPGTVSCIYLQGDADDDAVFGDGVRCTGGTLLRLRTRSNVLGASSFPDSTDTITLSQRGGVTIGSGVVRRYQTYYRNAAPLFCPPETFNVTNGWKITW